MALLDRKVESGEIDGDTYDKEFNKIINEHSEYYKELNNNLGAKVGGISFHNSKVYVDSYLENYGKEITTAYLKDIVFNDEASEFLRKRMAEGKISY